MPESQALHECMMQEALAWSQEVLGSSLSALWALVCKVGSTESQGYSEVRTHSTNAQMSACHAVGAQLKLDVIMVCILSPLEIA